MSYFSIPRSGLVGEFLLDSNANDTNDGTKSNATATNVSYVNAKSGYRKQSATFNSGGTSSVDTITLPSMSGAYSLVGHFTPTAAALSGTYRVMFRWSTGNANEEPMYLYYGGYLADGYRLDVQNTSNTHFNSNYSKTFVAGKTYLVFVTVGAGSASVYFDNALDNTLSYTGTAYTRTTGFAIGNRVYNRNEGWYGDIGGVRVYDHVLSEQERLQLWHEFNRKLGGGSDFGAYVPAPGLKFEMDSGLESSSQISVTNNSATLAQSDWLSLPKAVSFNGTTGSLGFTDSNTYSAITIGFRFYLNSLSSTRTPISTSGTGGYMFYVGTNGAGNWRTITGAANTATSSAGDFTTGTWYTVFMTYDGSVQNLYKNGTLIKSLTGLSGTIGSSSGYVGAYFDGLSSRMNGLISDIYIWNYAFTQDQIKFAGAAIESGRYPYAFRRSVPNAPSSPKFSIYLPSGKDISGNAKDATLINTPTAARLQQNGFLTFNGSSMAMTVPSSAYNPDGDTDNFSIAFWFVPAAIGTRAALFQKGASTTGTGYYQYTMEVTTGSKLDCQVGASAVSDTSCIGTTTLVNGRAYFGVMTYDAASKTFKNYLNGHLENTATHAYSTLAAPGRDWQFARRYRGDGVTDLFFNGKIGGLPMVFDRVLTLEEIQRLYFGTYVN